LGREDFVLLDVGSAGGIAEHWHIFADRLRAYGFDPWIEDCDEQNSKSPENIRYFANLIGLTDRNHWAFEKPARTTIQSWMSRSSAMAVPPELYLTTGYNPELWGASAAERVVPRTFTNKKIHLDTFVNEQGLDHVDFIKVDTDGNDLEVLLASEHTLAERSVLGLYVECQFQGDADPGANVFANIDRFLRSRGFSLYTLAPYTYSRAVLPMQFMYRQPAQTISGQVYWADAFYFRDFSADEGILAGLDADTRREKILKLASLYELHNLEDCAAELILSYQDELRPRVDVEHVLDLLTPQFNGRQLSYKGYVNEFRNDPENFYPVPGMVAPSPENARLYQEKFANLTRTVESLSATIQNLQCVIAAKDESIERLNNLYAAALRAQLESSGVKIE